MKGNQKNKTLAARLCTAHVVLSAYLDMKFRERKIILCTRDMVTV